MRKTDHVYVIRHADIIHVSSHLILVSRYNVVQKTRLLLCDSCLALQDRSLPSEGCVGLLCTSQEHNNEPMYYLNSMMFSPWQI